MSYARMYAPFKYIARRTSRLVCATRVIVRERAPPVVWRVLLGRWTRAGTPAGILCAIMDAICGFLSRGLRQREDRL